MNAVQSDVFWWLVNNGGEWVPICRQHPDCLRAYPRRFAAAKNLAGGGGKWGSPMRGHRGRHDVEASYQGGRYYFRWVPHPGLLEVERLAEELIGGVQRVPDDRGRDAP